MESLGVAAWCRWTMGVGFRLQRHSVSISLSTCAPPAACDATAAARSAWMRSCAWPVMPTTPWSTSTWSSAPRSAGSAASADTIAPSSAPSSSAVRGAPKLVEPRLSVTSPVPLRMPEGAGLTAFVPLEGPLIAPLTAGGTTCAWAKATVAARQEASAAGAARRNIESFMEGDSRNVGGLAAAWKSDGPRVARFPAASPSVAPWPAPRALPAGVRPRAGRRVFQAVLRAAVASLAAVLEAGTHARDLHGDRLDHRGVRGLELPHGGARGEQQRGGDEHGELQEHLHAG